MSDSPGMSGHHRPAADVEEDPVGLEELVVDPHGVRALEACVAADQGAAVHALQPRLDAFAVVDA